MLRFSSKYDLGNLDERYKELLKLQIYKRGKTDVLILKLDFCGYILSRFQNRSHSFKPTHMDGGARQPDLLIYDPTKPFFLLHIEFCLQKRSVNISLIRKEKPVEKPPQSSSMHKKGGEAEKKSGFLSEEEKLLATQVIDALAFWVWNRSV